MQFSPKSEKDLVKVVQPGEYYFEILDAQDDKSKKTGADMIKLGVGIYEGETIKHRIWDYLLPSVGYKLRHFCDATGLLSKYENGTLQATDCVGRSGKCKIGIQVDKTGQYPDKNQISDYICRAPKPVGGAIVAPPQSAPTPVDDSLPF